METRFRADQLYAAGMTGKFAGLRRKNFKLTISSLACYHMLYPAAAQINAEAAVFTC